MESSHRKRPIVIGHRGAAGHAPENTMVSFARALALGADAVELDLRLSRDGVPVVMHDRTVDRTCAGSGPVEMLTASQITSMDAGRSFGEDFAGEPVPTFEEVLAWARGRVDLVVELKGDPEPADALIRCSLDLLREYDMLERATVISFYHPSLAAVRELEPGLPTGMLYKSNREDAVRVACDAGVRFLSPHFRLWNEALLAAVREARLLASAWTVDEVPDIERLVAFGLDAITTNYPNRAREVLEALEPA